MADAELLGVGVVHPRGAHVCTVRADLGRLCRWAFSIGVYGDEPAVYTKAAVESEGGNAFPTPMVVAGLTELKT